MLDPTGQVAGPKKPKQAISAVDTTVPTQVQPENMLPQEDFSPAAIAQHDISVLQKSVQDATNAAVLASQKARNPYQAMGAAMMAKRAAATAAGIMQSMTGQGDLSKYPTLMKAVTQAAANGQDIDAQDVARLVNFAAAKRAADLYLSTTDQGRKNILLSQTPVQRAATLDVVEGMVNALNNSDQNAVLEALGNVAGTVLAPLEWLNENAQHLARAGWQGNDLQGGFNTMASLQAGISNLARGPQGWVNAWNATEKGQFDQQYIDTLKTSGQYTPTQVDVVTAIAKAQAEGDPDPVSTVMVQFADNPEADMAIRGLIYRGDAANEQMAELARQVDSANLGSTGQLFTTQALTPDSAQYSAFRGTGAREQTANAASIFYTFVLDPTIAGSEILGAYRAARYTIGKMVGPGKSAAKALASQKVAGVERNTARRYFDSLTADFRKLDSLKESGKRVEHAQLRQQMARQFRELPEDVIEEFRKAGVRSTDDVIRYLDDTSDAFNIAHGMPAKAALEAQQAIAGIPNSERLAMVLAARGDALRREALLPRKGYGRTIREMGARQVARMMPSKRAEEVIKSFYGDGTTDEIVKALDTQDGLIGKMDQSLNPLSTGVNGRRLDGLTRLFASLPNKSSINIADASDAGVFYKFARSFLTKRHADLLTDAFRDANIGQRRLMVAGVVRTAASARGVNLSDPVILEKIGDLATGTRSGELYSAGREMVDNAVDAGESGIENIIRYSPSNIDGHEHALHLWQTVDQVHIPSIKDLEALKRYRQIEPFKSLQDAPQKFTDYWSLFTLLGLRYAVRNGLEDLFTYALTGGKFGDLMAGRRVSTAYHDINPVFRNVLDANGKVKIGEDGLPVVEMKSTLGMIARGSRRIGDLAQRNALANRVLSKFFLSRFPSDEIVKAQYAAKAGDYEPMRKMFVTSAARLRLTGLTDKEIDDFADLLATPFGQTLMDEISEVTHYGISGAYPKLLDEADPAQGFVAGTLSNQKYTAFGDFIPVAEGARNPYYTYFWQRNLEGVMEHDGPIGKIAVSNLENRQAAIAKVAQAIRDDGQFGYKERFSALYTGQLSVDEFASRYVDDVYTMFSDAEGNLNKKLLDLVAPHGGDEIGPNWIPLYRVDDGSGAITGRPQGLYMSPIEDASKSPFYEDYASSGSVRETFARIRRSDVKSVEQRTIDIKGLRGRDPFTIEADAGVSYLLSQAPGEHLATIARAGDGARPSSEFLNALREVDATIDWLGFADNYERLSAAGAVLARRAGIKALHLEDTSVLARSGGPNFSEVVVLDDSAMVSRHSGRRVSLYDDGENGEKILRLTPGKLGQLRKDGAPSYVLGQDEIPFPETPQAMLSDRAWEAMGRQYARIAREPVFLANYKEQRALLRDLEDSLFDRIGPEASRQVMSKLAADRAYHFTLNYVDNATNRSQMAWKVRNVSRYYRATEDFYRRMQRMATTHPVAFWKAALTYQVLDDTGFVFTDGNGDKYFAYPGNELLQGAMRWFMQTALRTPSLDVDPWILGGKVSMLTPSLDPKQALPQVMGPMVLPVKALFSYFPEYEGLERYIIGDYAVDGSWYDSILPGNFSKIARTASDDERQSIYASSIMDAIAIASAHGLLPTKNADGSPIATPEQLMQSPQWEAIRAMAWGNTISKYVMGLAVPASPQVYKNDVTLYARQHGIASMRQSFMDLVAKTGDFGQAMTEWWQLNPNGDLMPFTISRSSTPDSVNKLADVQSVKGLTNWYNENKDLYQRNPNGALFLAPRSGDFSWASWRLMSTTLRLKEPKDTETFLQDVSTSIAKSSYFATIADYDADIRKLDPNNPIQAKQIKQLEDSKSADLKYLRNQDPMLAKALAEGSSFDTAAQYAQIAFNDTSSLVHWMADNGRETPVSLAMRQVIDTFNDYASDIKAITGRTDAENTEKKSLRMSLRADLEVLANRNPNVRVFVDNVLSSLPEMGGL